MNRELVNILRITVDALPSKIRNSKFFFFVAQKIFSLPNHLFSFREDYKNGKIKDLSSLYIKGNPKELPDANDEGAINWFHIRLIKKYIKKHSPKSVLDVGCGPGYLVSLLDQLISESKIIGIDVEVPELNNLIYKKNTNNNVKFLRGKVDNLLKKFEDNSFETVICTHFLEHIEYPQKVIRELRRISTGNS